MTRLAAFAMIVLAGCEEHGSRLPGGVDAAGTGDGGTLPERTCPIGREKLKFMFATSCGNDGSVEFCIPNDPGVQMRVIGVSSNIRCDAGGGIAGCNNSPGRLRCVYPTSFPAECLTSHGAMTDATWSDMCELAGMPEIVEVVPTFFEG